MSSERESMIACTFWGHRESRLRKLKLKRIIVELLTSHGVNVFYVGNQGQFDVIVRNVLQEISEEYSYINYAVVLAYIPQKHSEYDDYSDTMLPEGIENVHPHYAISWRNDWMLRQSEFVITYILHSWGCAAKYAAKAKRQGKTVINVVD